MCVKYINQLILHQRNNFNVGTHALVAEAGVSCWEKEGWGIIIVVDVGSLCSYQMDTKVISHVNHVE